MRFLAALVLVSCGPVQEMPSPSWCEAGTAHLYDPFVRDTLDQWPDDLHALIDPSSPTGVRLSLDPTKARWSVDLPPLVAELAGMVSEASGFSRHGAIVLRFSGPVGELVDRGRGGALRLLDLSVTPAEDVPFEVTLGADGTQIQVQPLRPLRAGARHGVVLTNEHAAGDGGCVSPGPVLRELLDGEVSDPRLQRLVPRYAELIEAAGLSSPHLVSAATVFTVADDLGPMRGAAADLKDRAWRWEGDATCRPGEAGGTVCDRAFRGLDYRKPGGLVTASGQGSWTLPVRAWLPAGPGPHPVVIYGHGMNGNRDEARHLAARVADLGLAVVAVDAMHHGDHPSRVPGEEPGFAFLGIDMDGLKIDGVRMRTSFDQSGLDKLQLLEVLKADADLDGDGVDDLQLDQMAYVGVSLGGLLGPSLLALSGDIDAAALPVGGAYLMKFATDVELVDSFKPLFASLVGGEDALEALLVVAQSAVDGSDPATFAAHVLQQRFDEQPAPHLLLPVATDDEIVPPSTGRALARALGLPHIPPVAVPVAGLDLGAPAPVAGNARAGRTAGFFQIDRITNDGVVEVARHANTPLSEECVHQWHAFLQTWLDDGVPTIVDPFVELGTPPR